MAKTKSVLEVRQEYLRKVNDSVSFIIINFIEIFNIFLDYNSHML